MELPVKTGPLPVQNTLWTKMDQNTPWEFRSFPLHDYILMPKKKNNILVNLLFDRVVPS